MSEIAVAIGSLAVIGGVAYASGIFDSAPALSPQGSQYMQTKDDVQDNSNSTKNDLGNWGVSPFAPLNLYTPSSGSATDNPDPNPDPAPNARPQTGSVGSTGSDHEQGVAIDGLDGLTDSANNEAVKTLWSPTVTSDGRAELTTANIAKAGMQQGLPAAMIKAMSAAMVPRTYIYDSTARKMISVGPEACASGVYQTPGGVYTGQACLVYDEAGGDYDAYSQSQWQDYVYNTQMNFGGSPELLQTMMNAYSDCRQGDYQKPDAMRYWWSPAALLADNIYQATQNYVSVDDCADTFLDQPTFVLNFTNPYHSAGGVGAGATAVQSSNGTVMLSGPGALGGVYLPSQNPSQLIADAQSKWKLSAPAS